MHFVSTLELFDGIVDCDTRALCLSARDAYAKQLLKRISHFITRMMAFAAQMRSSRVGGGAIVK